MADRLSPRTGVNVDVSSMPLLRALPPLVLTPNPFTLGLFDALRTKGTTILMSTHYIEEAERLADEVAVMAHGKIISRGRPAELVAEHAGRETAEVYAPPERLAVSADVTFDRAGFWAVELTAEYDGGTHSGRSVFEVLEQHKIPALGEDESYVLDVGEQGATLSAPTFRGLQCRMPTWISHSITGNKAISAAGMTTQPQCAEPWR